MKRNVIDFIKFDSTTRESFTLEGTATRGTFRIGNHVTISGKSRTGEKSVQKIFSSIGAQSEINLSQEFKETRREQGTFGYNGKPGIISWELTTEDTPYRVNFSRKTMLPYIRTCDEDKSERVAFIAIGCKDKLVTEFKVFQADLLQSAFDIETRELSMIVRFKHEKAKLVIGITDKAKTRTVFASFELDAQGDKVDVSYEIKDIPTIHKCNVRKRRLFKYVPSVIPSVILCGDDEAFQTVMDNSRSGDPLYKNKDIVKVNRKNIFKVIKKFKKDGFRACALCGIPIEWQDRILSEIHIVFELNPLTHEVEPISKYWRKGNR